LRNLTKRADSMLLLQIQRSVQAQNRSVDAEPVQLAGADRQLAGRADAVDPPGGGVHGRRRGQAAARGGEEVRQRRQVVAARDATRSRHAQRRRVLRRRRLPGADVALSTAAARTLPKVTHRVTTHYTV